MEKWTPKRGEKIEVSDDKFKWKQGIFLGIFEDKTAVIFTHTLPYFDNLTAHDKHHCLRFYYFYRKIKTKEEKKIEILEEKIKQLEK